MTQAYTKQIKDACSGVFNEYTIETFEVYSMGSKSYTNELLMNY